MFLEDIQQSPNPQFARLPIHDLTGPWEFAFDDEDLGQREKWYQPDHRLDRTITVPYPPESSLSGIDDKSFHPVCWYRREFADPRADAREHLLLMFGAVDYHATVWVDGACVGAHEGGSTPFALDITDALDPARTRHVVTVRVFDDPHDLEQPRGKQSWNEEPHTIFYHRTTGIWQPVWFEIVPETRIEDIRWTFDRARWTVSVDVSISRPAVEGSSISVVLEHEDDCLASGQWSTRGRHLRTSLDIRGNARNEDLGQFLWSPSRPTLIGARVTLSAPGQPDDVVLGYIGLRTVETDNRYLRINGEATYLRMVLSQGFWPESHLAAPSPDALKREAELILSLGFNAARLHQKVEDPRFLYWADKLGLLLWGEIGNAFRYSDRAIGRHAKEWREAVIRDRNHPSIIAWVPFNESWGVDDVAHVANQQEAVKAVYHATHHLDGTRPVIGNDGWENVVGDLLTAHDYSWNTDRLEKLYGSDSVVEELVVGYSLSNRPLVVGDCDPENKPILLSEFGGVSYSPDPDQPWFGYGVVKDRDDFVQQYRTLVETVSSSTRLAGFCYTQLTDTLQETNGLLDEHRSPKAEIEVLREITVDRHTGRVGA